jgi:serine O-acetyltransferase
MSDRTDDAVPPSGGEMARFNTWFVEHMATRPPLVEALTRDARAFALQRMEQWPDSGWRQFLAGVRLCWTSDDFAGIALYRLRTKLRRMGVPVLPALLHRVCIMCFGIRIGDRAVIQPGVYVPHGNIVIDGIVSVGRDAVLCPWITIGLIQSNIFGPTVGDGVFVGTGAKIIGPVTIGDNATVGAGSVVVRDVPPGSSVSGVPARPAAPRPGDSEPS